MIALGIESSNSRGMGHLFRSFLYVDYLNNQKKEFIYLINDDERSIKILKERNTPYIIVDYHDTQSKWEQRIIDEFGVDIWINDKFETSEEMARNIKEKGIMFALIDDIGPGEILADIHFVGLISFTKKSFRSSNTLIGMDYVILNKEIDLYKRERKSINNIIVSFGGSDPYCNTLSVVKYLINTNYNFDITIGPNSKCENELRELCNGRYKIYQNVPSLIELFSHYDMVITGGGVTSCEANAAGLPCVIIANAPHEINTGKYMEKFGGCIYAGSYQAWDKQIIDSIKDFDISAMSLNGMKVFKTDAVDRIFDKVFKLNGNLSEGKKNE